MNIDSYDKFKEYVNSFNKGGFQGKFYLEKGVDNAFIWEYNEIFKFQIIFDWYDNFSEFTIGCEIKFDEKILDTHWYICSDEIVNELERIEEDGVVCIINKNLFGFYSLKNIMFISDYNEKIKNKYKDSFFNKYFEVFSKDK